MMLNISLEYFRLLVVKYREEQIPVWDIFGLQ